jgi:hypothetical protein
MPLTTEESSRHPLRPPLLGAGARADIPDATMALQPAPVSLASHACDRFPTLC